MKTLNLGQIIFFPYNRTFQIEFDIGLFKLNLLWCFLSPFPLVGSVLWLDITSRGAPRQLSQR